LTTVATSELLDRGANVRCRTLRLRSGQTRMKPIKLPHLAIGSPAEIAVAGILQIHAGNLLEAARRIEAGSELIGERLVVNEAVCAGRANGLFVEALGIGAPGPRAAQSRRPPARRDSRNYPGNSAAQSWSCSWMRSEGVQVLLLVRWRGVRRMRRGTSAP